MDSHITIERVTIENSVFGSAPDSFWSHGVLAKAWADGFPKEVGKAKRRPDDYASQYLHVPCHDQTYDGKCPVCREYGRNQTSHRLYYRKRHFKRIDSVRLGKMGGFWFWIVTWRKQAKKVRRG